jgi:hypothetical protein
VTPRYGSLLAGASLVFFEVVGPVWKVETIAVGRGIRDFARLNRLYGPGTWRKLKGEATVRLADGTFRRVELHSYEAHGIGKRKLKIKRFLEPR